MVFWRKSKVAQNVVYLIDDDLDILDVYEDFINHSLKDLSVKKFSCLKKALESLEGEVVKPNLIVCDIRLPDENGLKLFEHLKGLGLDIPVLHVSGLDGEDIHTPKYNILSKPIDPDDFIENIKKYISKSEGKQAS